MLLIPQHWNGRALEQLALHIPLEWSAECANSQSRLLLLLAWAHLLPCLPMLDLDTAAGMGAITAGIEAIMAGTLVAVDAASARAQPSASGSPVSQRAR